MRELVRILKALSDRNRLRILKLLENRILSVGEIQQALGLTQPSISMQLKILWNAGLVDNKKQGPRTNYFISAQSIYAKVLLKELNSWLRDRKSVV